MENKPAFVLALYQEEKARLEALIKLCLEGLEGPDYLSAHNYQNALNRVNGTIWTLNRFEDKKYDDRQRYQKLLAIYENILLSKDDGSMKKHIPGIIQMIKEKLEELPETEPSGNIQNDSGILEKAILDLVSKKIKKFKIIFNKSEGVFLEISAKGRDIKLVSSVVKKADLYSLQLGLLPKLGFRLTKRNKLVCQLKNVNESSLDELRFLLTRIVFDVYYFRHPAKENFIEF